jgi:RHS repeat-associated protein
MRKPLKSLIFKSIIYFFIAVIGFLQPTLALVNPTPAYATTAQYQYDPMGQMTTDGETCYEYNDIHKLKAVKDCYTGDLQEEYVFDFDGTRIIKKVYEHGTLTETIYQPTDSYETRVDTQTGETTNTIYYRVNGELVASKQTPEATPTATQTVYYHNDHLQSTSTLTDQQGNVLETTEYKPYGDTLGTTDTTGQALANSQSKYQFTGQEKDQTGLYYYGARYYDPNLKRFTSADSLLPDPYDPQQLNRYSYVRNNPIKYVDPSGNWLLAPPVFYPISPPDPMSSQRAMHLYSMDPEGYMFTKYMYEQTQKDILGYGTNAVLSTGITDNRDTAESIFKISADLAIIAGLSYGIYAEAGAAGIRPISGSGKWIETSETMSSHAAKYQEYITGRPASNSFYQNGVKFDGYLMDAKSGYGNFVNPSTGKFYDWFTGDVKLLQQANRQVKAANGKTIKWYWENENAMKATQDAFNAGGVSGIEMIYKPM